MNSKEKLVSIVVPVYNVEKYLKDCLNSIVLQTHKNIEIICIDDGSPDNSIEILNEFQKKDNRIQIIRQENKGLSAARNTGIKYANGEYIIFVDSDDTIEKDMVELMYNKLEKYKFDLVICGRNMVYSDLERVEKNLEKLERILPKEISGQEYFKLSTSKINSFTASCCDKIYKLSMIRNKNILFSEGRVYEDLLFVFRYMINCQKVGVEKKALYNYYVRRNTSITNLINESDIEDSIFTLNSLEKFLVDYNFKDMLNSIEFKEYMFLWISRATLFKLIHLSKIYDRDEINEVINKVKNNNEYKKLCQFILKNSKNKRNKFFIKVLYLNNIIFLWMLKINEYRQKLEGKFGNGK